MMAHTSSTHTDTYFSHLLMQLMHVLCLHNNPSESLPLAYPSHPTQVTHLIYPSIHASKHTSSTLPAHSLHFQTPPRTHFLCPLPHCGIFYMISCLQYNMQARHATCSTASLAQCFCRQCWSSCPCYLWPSLPHPCLHLGFLPCCHMLWGDF